jgi:hypothetical protein
MHVDGMQLIEPVEHKIWTIWKMESIGKTEEICGNLVIHVLFIVLVSTEPERGLGNREREKPLGKK